MHYSAIIGLGQTARTIVSAAASNHCDSIVMGASLWSQIKACIGGGLPAKVMRRTSVPVTVGESLPAQQTQRSIFRNLSRSMVTLVIKLWFIHRHIERRGTSLVTGVCRTRAWRAFLNARISFDDGRC
ncbi:universal stress protein [Cupriavidus basilensis]